MTTTVLLFPIIVCKFALKLILLCIRLALQLLRFVVDWFKESTAEEIAKQELLRELDTVTTYEEYIKCATELDKLTGYDIWKRDNESALYDYEQIEDKLYSFQEMCNQLQGIARSSHVLQNNGVHPSPSIAAQICMTVRSVANRNLCGIGNPNLYKCAVGTKELIERYTDQACHTLHLIRTCHFEDFSLLDKYLFFRDTVQIYGRTALLLSGGASMGMYHIGVIKALYDQNLLPRIINGTSAGAIVASIFCVRNDDEIPECFERGFFRLEAFKNLDNAKSPLRKMMRFFKTGVLMDIKKLQDCLRENIGDVTFLEAYRRSGRILNITVSNSKGFAVPSLLNFLTSPNVLIWSAACASCSIPGVFKPCMLMAKDQFGNVIPYHSPSLKFTDGSFYADLPQQRLAELFNVNFFIVSQTNPYVVPFLTDTDDTGGPMRTFWKKIKYFVLSEVKHRLLQLYEYNLVPKFLYFFESLISQQYTGDVTILPATYDYENLSKLLQNPTDDFIQECNLRSQQRTFPKISVIQTRCKIERALDSCLIEIRQQLLNMLHISPVQNVPDELLLPLAKKNLMVDYNVPAQKLVHHEKLTAFTRDDDMVAATPTTESTHQQQFHHIVDVNTC